MNRDLDTQKLSAFGKKIGGILNGAAAALMISVGHKVRLFDVISEIGACSSSKLAEAAGLDERYVREWLGAMTTAGIVSYDAFRGLYVLPAEHAAMLTRSAGPRNQSLYMQYIPLLAQVEDQIVDHFKSGGGVPYSEYSTFHAVMAEASAARFDSLLVETILPLVPNIVEHLDSGINVSDVGCGSGHAINVMAQAFPNSTFTGIDFSSEAIGVAREEAMQLELANVDFVEQDAANLQFDQVFDFVTTFDAVHDQAQPQKMVAGIYASLKSGGYWLCADLCASSHLGENLDHPIGTFGYTVSCMHCMSVSLAYDGEGLGAMWGAQKAQEIFTDAGFKVEEVARVDGDAGNNYYLCRRPL
ncbi:MAG: methyltransferase domain-containing protein [Acidimicrobiales bacterium]|nr:methyltransferase domain-containing protein [Acidimicrobiales bacterium]